MLNSFRSILLFLRIFYLRKIRGLDIHHDVRMSMSAKIDTVFRAGIHIDAGTYIAFNARIMSHDYTRGLYLHTRIGKNCFIGGESLILPGVTIGDGCIVGACSVVTIDVPDGCIVAGNPARIIRENIEVGKFGRLAVARENRRRLYRGDPDVAKLLAKKSRKRIFRK